MVRRRLAVFLSFGVVLTLSPPARTQTQAGPARLNLVVVEGEGAINNIRQRVTREPIVQVEDENHRPVAGAVVVFTLPGQGAGGTFAGGAHSLTVTTDAQGRAIARGFQPNSVKGSYQMRVNASANGQTASTNISMSNVTAATAAGAAGGLSAKAIALIAVGVGAGVAAGVVAGTRGGGGNNNAAITTNPSTNLITITPGSGSVGPPR